MTLTWILKNRLDIEIPLDNDLSNTSRLIAAVQAAETFMRELWPSSVHASVQYNKGTLRADRWAVHGGCRLLLMENDLQLSGQGACGHLIRVRLFCRFKGQND